MARQQKVSLPPLQNRTKVRSPCAGNRGLCTVLLLQTLSWALSRIEARLVCVTAQLVSLERSGCTCWPHCNVLRIKHRATLSWPTVAPLTLLEKRSRGGGRDLRDSYWSRFTSWRDLEQMIRSPVGQWSRSVILIWKSSRERIKLLTQWFCREIWSWCFAIRLQGSEEREGPCYRTLCTGNFFFELVLFFWCCFDVAGLILCYSPPQGTVNTEGLGEDELGQDKRHTPQHRLQHNSNRAELPPWLLAYFSVHSGIHPSSSGMHHHCILTVSGLSKE